jgi:HEAT repeat protein
MAVGRRVVVALLIATAVAVAAYALLAPREEVAGPAVERGDPVAVEAKGPQLGGRTEEEARALRERRATAWRGQLEAADGAVQRAALERWDRSGLDPAGAAAEIVPLLADAEAKTRDAARETLVAIGAPAVEALLRVGLTSSDWEVPALAIDALGALAQAGSGRAATDALLGILGDASARRTWRQHAAMSLGQIRPVEDRVREALLAALGDPSDEVTSAAADGLASLGEHGEPLVPRLVDLLEGRAKGHRSDAAVALAGIARRADLAVPALLRHDDWRLVPHAVAAFGRDALPGLRAGLADPSISVRNMAYQALVKLGPTAGPLAPDVVAAIRKDEQAIWLGCEALRAIGLTARGVIPDLEALVGTAPDEADAVTRALAPMGPEGEAALRRLLDHEAEGVRRAACVAFFHRKDLTADSRARLAAVAEGDTSTFVRHSAAWALKTLESR